MKKVFIIILLISFLLTFFSAFNFKKKKDFIPVYDKMFFCEKNKEIDYCKCKECFLALGFPFSFLYVDINNFNLKIWDFYFESFVLNVIFYFLISFLVYFSVKKFRNKK